MTPVAPRHKPTIEPQLFMAGQMIGWARAVDRGNHDVVHVFVVPEFRHRGLGMMLISAAQTAARSAWPEARFRCNCARDLRQGDAPELHASFCSERRRRRPS